MKVERCPRRAFAVMVIVLGLLVGSAGSALAIAESNLCAYCLRAHGAVATKIGLTQAEIGDASRARAAEATTDAILKLARSIVVQRGELSDRDLALARAGGLSDREIVETVANVALNIFEKYMSHVARMPSDFLQSGSDRTFG